MANTVTARREAVVVTRAVAAQYWLRPFDEVLALARTGTDGLLAVEQEAVDGRWPVDKRAYENKTDTAILIRSEMGNCELYQQGWIDGTFVPPYTVG